MGQKRIPLYFYYYYYFRAFLLWRPEYYFLTAYKTAGIFSAPRVHGRNARIDTITYITSAPKKTALTAAKRLLRFIYVNLKYKKLKRLFSYFCGV